MHRGLRKLRLWVIALGGVFAGHGAALAVPGSSTHIHADGSTHIHDAMHGYLPTTMRFVLPLAAVALLSLIVESIRTRDGSTAVLGLVRLQIAAFVALEVGEHLVAGVPVQSLIDAPVLWLGLAAQLAVSGGLIGLATLAHRWAVVRSVSLPSTNLVSTKAPQPASVEIARPHSLLRSFSITTRGPPTALLT